jgi:hypothetical protein
VRVKTPTSGRLTATLSAKHKGRTVSLGSDRAVVRAAGSVTLRITVSKGRWKQLQRTKVKSGTLKLTFAPTTGTSGSTTKKVAF